MEKINLILPMNGIGLRFRQDNYYTPKPLINVLGKPMIFWLLDNLDLKLLDKIVIPYTSQLDDFNFQNLLRTRYKEIEIIFISLRYKTSGPVETIQLGLNYIEDNTNIVVMDCDNFYNDNILELYQESNNKNVIFYSIDENQIPYFSYIVLDSKDSVVNIKEKQKISNNANTGIYCFENKKLLKEYIDKCVSVEKEEYFVSDLYALMIVDNINVTGIKIDDFNCLGTPVQLKIFCENNNVSTKTFCCEINNLLFTGIELDQNQLLGRPIIENIETINGLYEMGHIINLMANYDLKNHKNKLIELLKFHNIKYSELIFDLRHNDFYISNNAINSNYNIEKQIGFYNTKIKSRKFNTLEFLDKTVIKKGNIDGEKYYYQNIDRYPFIKSYFPNLIDSDDDKIIIEKIYGINFSYLYTHNNLSVNDLEKLLLTLKTIHSLPCNEITNDFVHSSYIEKIQSRVRNYNYSKFFDYHNTMKSLLDFIQGYKINNISIIHGDPVFTNIMLTDTFELKFFDMRGKIGNKFTMGGDPLYDISKVFQSLSGYDFILQGIPVIANNELLSFFYNFISKYYNYSKEDIHKFTASLYFTLIPLHDDDKCNLYYEKCLELLKDEVCVY